MGTEDPMSMEAYTTITREVLSVIRISRDDGLPISEIIRMNKEELDEHFPYASLTFFQEEVVNNLYAGYDDSEIPRWTDGANANKILQSYYKKCPLSQADLKTKFQETFAKDSPENKKYDAIKALLRCHSNTGIKSAFHEFLSIGSRTSDFLYYKGEHWKEAKTAMEEWKSSREEFNTYLDAADATVDTVNTKYTDLSAALGRASTSLEQYLKYGLKKHKHLTPSDQLKANQYMEVIATEDSLNDIMETKGGLYTIKTNLTMKEFFKDLRTAASNDRKELMQFRKNARGDEDGINSRQLEIN